MGGTIFLKRGHASVVEFLILDVWHIPGFLSDLQADSCTNFSAIHEYLKELQFETGFTCWISFAPVFSFMYCWVLIFALSTFMPLSSTRSILSNTDLSDLSTVGTCDIFVYQMRQRVMWFANWLIQHCLSSVSSRVTETVSMKMPCGECFQKCFSAYNIISLWLNTVIPIIVLIWLPKTTRYLHWRIVCRHLTLVTF